MHSTGSVDKEVLYGTRRMCKTVMYSIEKIVYKSTYSHLSSPVSGIHICTLVTVDMLHKICNLCTAGTPVLFLLK